MRYEERIRAQFAKLAEEYKLTEQPADLAKVSGLIGQQQTTITCIDRTITYDDIIAFSTIEIACKLPPNILFVLHREKLIHDFFGKYGMQDFQFNEKRFDDNFIIKSNNELFARNILTPDLRNLLVRDMNLISGFRFGPSRFKLAWDKLSFRSKKPADDLEDVLDFPLDQPDESAQNEYRKNTTEPGTTIDTKFLHNMETDMKRGWMNRALETSLLLAKNIELVSNNMKLY